MSNTRNAGAQDVGVFVPLPDILASQFPAKKEDTSKPHVTLCYFGKVAEKSRQQLLLEAVKEFYLSEVGPIEARLMGVDYFRSPTGSVAYSRVTFSKDMGAMKDRLKSYLSSKGFTFHDLYPGAFTPHVTLAYYNNPYAVWDGVVPAGAWSFNQVEVWGLSKTHTLNLSTRGYFTSFADMLEPHKNLRSAWGPFLRRSGR